MKTPVLNSIEQKMFLGTVTSIFEDNTQNSESEPRTNQIKFNILGLPDFGEDQPIATLLGNNTYQVNVGDLVFIIDICTISTGMHTFMYMPVFEERFTGIRKYDNEINLTEKNYAHIKLPNTEIDFDRHSSSNKGDDQDDLKDGQGEVVIKIDNTCTITFDCNSKSTTIACNGMLNLKGGKGQAININSIEGNVGFSCIPVCPFTGATHTIGTVPTL
jgi:hypothetical protein